MINKYEIIIHWSDEDQAFLADVPELPGCIANGDTYESALANIKSAMDLWIETAREFNDPIPATKGRRVVAVFEPRSNSSRRNIFQYTYVSSFTDADLVIIPEPPMMGKIPAHERFSSSQLVRDLQKSGTESHYFANTSDLLNGLLALIKKGDIVLFMSNGPFDNIQKRFLQRLEDYLPDPP